MPTTTTTYSFNKPVVGADEDDWGGYLNGNWDSVDDLLDGTTPITGIDINSGTLDGVTIGGTTAGAGTFTTLTANTSITGTLATAAQPNVTSLGTLTSLAVSGDVSFGDNDKAIFGAGSDLQIYHNGTDSIVRDAGTGNLVLGGDASVRIATAGLGETLAQFNVNGSVDLYYDNALKLATTSTGIDVTGTVTADGLTVDGDVNMSDSTPVFTMTDTDGGSANMSVYSGSLVISADSANEYTSRVLQLGVGDKEYFNLDDSGDISFREDTGTTAKFFWDASAESLGIGTTTVSDPLHIAAIDPAIRFEDTSSGITGYSRIFTDNNNAMTFDIDAGNNRALSAAIFKVDGTERMRIDSSGNVGIGTDSPEAKVEIQDGSDSKLRLQTTVGTDRKFNIGVTSSTNAVINVESNHDLEFHTNNTERMRIDSSGNLLVGKTSADAGVTAGAELQSSGLFYLTRTGTPTVINRLGSDGDIAAFRKDGSTVGSIGTIGGDVYFTSSGANAGLRSYDAANALSPVTNTGGLSNGNVSLGWTDSRFKDLYLSGGVYLGGTGSANKLDDYEFGTWTPALSGATGETYGTQQGFYTKIGNQVTCQFYMSITGAPTGGSNIYIALPFAPQGSVTGIHGGRLMRANALTVSDQYRFFISPYNGSTAAYLYNDAGGVLNYISAFTTGVISAAFTYTT